MCGIVGLFLKDTGSSRELGRLTGLMLRELATAGPTAPGFAVYGDETAGMTKICAVTRTGSVDWAQVAEAARPRAWARASRSRRSRTTRSSGPAATGDTARKWLIDNVPEATMC